MAYFDEDLSSLKKDDHYHFSVPFEYIEKNYGNDNYDIATMNMEVDVDWDASEEGYVITYYAPMFDLVDPAEGNGDIHVFYEYHVDPIVRNELDMLGIPAGAIATW